MVIIAQGAQSIEASAMRLTHALGLVGVFGLCGCGLFPSAAERAIQKRPDFRAGYSDGCAAATATGANPREGPYRDETLYQASQAYRSGWGNGYSLCRREGTGAEP